jgi:hypothetical protein
MSFIQTLIEYILHLDKFLGQIIQQYGTWTYLLLFLVIFMETGLVVTPFCQVTSLLFAAGTFAGWDTETSRSYSSCCAAHPGRYGQLLDRHYIAPGVQWKYTFL